MTKSFARATGITRTMRETFQREEPTERRRRPIFVHVPVVVCTGPDGKAIRLIGHRAVTVQSIGR